METRRHIMYESASQVVAQAIADEGFENDRPADLDAEGQPGCDWHGLNNRRVRSAKESLESTNHWVSVIWARRRQHTFS